MPRLLLARSRATQVRETFEQLFASYPHRIEVRDWHGDEYVLGGGAPHWSGQALRIVLNDESVARDIVRLDGMGFLERFLEGAVDLSGNLYALSDMREHANITLPAWRLAGMAARNFAFQNIRRARVSVKSHYDVPQEALSIYLDRVYQSYSCAMFEDPERRERDELIRPGNGASDDFDSLEKAQWRKFKDAADFIAPRSGETLLDVGCGYGGQLAVALEHHPFGKVVGWTHSANQVREGGKMLARFDSDRWEIREGDYREERRVFDHITSTGMVCHVGPRGLIPYVRNIRQRIRRGGRYMHHVMMVPHSRIPLDLEVGPAFNKKYVWPGFHWFTLGDHTNALERNGFHVLGLKNLTRHYAKTTASWYERMMHGAAGVRAQLGEPTFRAWQVFLAGITGAYLTKNVHLYRMYCEAI